MQKLLVLCPSRGRPERIKDFLDSFESTTDCFHTKLAVLLDKDDPCIPQYMEVIPSWAIVRLYDRDWETISRRFKTI
jgi:hypothetical protein